jgi:predicted ester cyclase
MLQADVIETGEELGPDYVERDVELWVSAFPDLHWHVDAVVTAGETAVARLRWVGTHEGPFMGLEATGVAVVVHASYTARIRQGRVAEGWLLWDRLGLFQQLGILPSTAAILRARSSSVDDPSL